MCICGLLCAFSTNFNIHRKQFMLCLHLFPMFDFKLKQMLLLLRSIRIGEENASTGLCMSQVQGTGYVHVYFKRFSSLVKAIASWCCKPLQI